MKNIREIAEQRNLAKLQIKQIRSDLARLTSEALNYNQVATILDNVSELVHELRETTGLEDYIRDVFEKLENQAELDALGKKYTEKFNA